MKNRMLPRLAAALVALALLCTAASALADSVTLADTVDYRDGYTTISWTGDAASNYEVYVEAINNGPSEQSKVYGGKTTRNSIQVTDMIPGKSYTVYVCDTTGKILGRHDYTMPEPAVFVDGKLKNTSIKISLDPRRLKIGDSAKKAQKLSQFKASEIQKGTEENTYYYGVRYSMKMPQLGHERNFLLTLAFESPSGYLLVVYAENMKYEYVARGYQTISFYILGTNYFPNLLKTTGTIETGKYKTYMFLDGMLVNENTFVVK